MSKLAVRHLVATSHGSDNHCFQNHTEPMRLRQIANKGAVKDVAIPKETTEKRREADATMYAVLRILYMLISRGLQIQGTS